ncbi:MAG: hypothetical protein R3C44_18945 [Chloroflexota bacterium]
MEALHNIGVAIVVAIGIAGALALILFVVVLLQARKINVPPGAGFGETLLHTPLSVVLFLDVMDLALDLLGAPIAWVVLDRLGLKALRGVAAVEALIPFTQLIPLMTLSWIVARVLGPQRVEAIESTGSYTKYMRTAEKSPPADDYDFYSD